MHKRQRPIETAPARTKIRCFLFGIMLVFYYSLLVCFCNLKHCKIYKQYVKFYMDTLNNKIKEHLLSMPRNGTSLVLLKLLACHLDCVYLSPPSPHQITTVLNFIFIILLFSLQLLPGQNVSLKNNFLIMYILKFI